MRVFCLIHGPAVLGHFGLARVGRYHIPCLAVWGSLKLGTSRLCRCLIWPKMQKPPIRRFGASSQDRYIKLAADQVNARGSVWRHLRPIAWLARVRFWRKTPLKYSAVMTLMSSRDSERGAVGAVKCMEACSYYFHCVLDLWRQLCFHFHSSALCAVPSINQVIKPEFGRKSSWGFEFVSFPEVYGPYLGKTLMRMCV